MNPIDPSQVRKDAETMFNNGLCCSESALLALAKAQGIESPGIPAMATPFCGGMARTGGTCGALAGALMGASLTLGRSSASESQKTAGRATRRIVREFEQAFGSQDCHVLVGFDPADKATHSAFEREGRRDRCAIFTGAATEMAARVINDSEK